MCVKCAFIEKQSLKISLGEFREQRIFIVKLFLVQRSVRILSDSPFLHLVDNEFVRQGFYRKYKTKEKKAIFFAIYQNLDISLMKFIRTALMIGCFDGRKISIGFRMKKDCFA